MVDQLVPRFESGGSTATGPGNVGSGRCHPLTLCGGGERGAPPLFFSEYAP